MLPSLICCGVLYDVVFHDAQVACVAREQDADGAEALGQCYRLRATQQQYRLELDDGALRATFEE